MPGKQYVHTISGAAKKLDLNNAQDHFVMAPFLYPNLDGVMVEMGSTKKVNPEELSQGGFADLHLTQPKELALPNYVKLVNEGIEEINKGTFSKIVLSRKKEVDIDSSMLLNIYADLCHTYRDAFVYLLSCPKFGTWMGASPELLLAKGGGKSKTVSLAGTKNKNQDGWGTKEIEEQDIVTQFIVEGLSSEVKNLHVSEPDTASIGHISHIKKEVTFDYEGNPEKIIDILHPTPAVCGMPKIASKEYILNEEGYDRSLYTGFLGPISSNKELKLFVNLRCMQVFQNKAQLYLGAGITKDSVAENEFEETENKSNILLTVMN